MTLRPRLLSAIAFVVPSCPIAVKKSLKGVHCAPLLIISPTKLICSITELRIIRFAGSGDIVGRIVGLEDGLDWYGL